MRFFILLLGILAFRFSYSQSKTFFEYFPDKELAQLVAEKMNKNVSESVTKKELASIRGYFTVGPGEVSSLKGIGLLTGLDSFSCYKNNVTFMPEEIGKLKNLIYLDFCKAFRLQNISPAIGKLTKLKKIRINLTGGITVLPKEIGNLSNLEYLWICCNDISSIPKEIGNLKKLKDLEISSNKLKNIPDEICNLQSLEELVLAHNKLTKLPENIGRLKKLKRLNLFGNDIKKLPKSIKQLNNLTSLNVYDNYNLHEGYKKYLPKKLKKD